MNRVVIFLFCLFFTLPAVAKWYGPLGTPSSLLERMNQKFAADVLGESGKISIDSKCRIESDVNEVILGAVDEKSGRSHTQEPNLMFWNWQMDCVKQFWNKRILSGGDDIDWNRFLGASLVEELKQVGEFEDLKWFMLNASLRKKVGRKIFDRIVDHRIMKEFGRDPDTFVQQKILSQVKGSDTFFQAIYTIYFVGLSSDEFLFE